MSSANSKVIKTHSAPRYTLGEEIFNSVSHGVGAVFAIVATVLVIIQAAIHGDAFTVVSSAIYGATLIILYTMSTLYHALTSPGAKKVFRVFDHCSIYLLIAGTYTPITLAVFRNAIGWVIFGVVWGAAIIGIVLNSISLNKFKVFSYILYILMGWAVVAAFPTLLSVVPFPGIVLLVSGGIMYTAGMTFYALKKIKFMHSIWHLFVLSGSVLHFIMIMMYAMQ